ncbi:hypothetical protein [Microlunatus ginsengisoli]|uniref:Uncharacterized protein n=1 Tax=Microlunatus ginsengisoli TaxID=363863 RepID=A0ABP7AXC7_9ACTN
MLNQAADRGDPTAELPSAPVAADAVAAVRLGIWISATRCFLTYVVAPAAGALGLFVGPVGLVLQVLGAITATSGARTLWSLGHRARFVYAFVAGAVTLAAAASLVRCLMGVLR